MPANPAEAIDALWRRRRPQRDLPAMPGSGTPEAEAAPEQLADKVERFNSFISRLRSKYGAGGDRSAAYRVEEGGDVQTGPVHAAAAAPACDTVAADAAAERPARLPERGPTRRPSQSRSKSRSSSKPPLPPSGDAIDIPLTRRRKSRSGGAAAAVRALHAAHGHTTKRCGYDPEEVDPALAHSLSERELQKLRGAAARHAQAAAQLGLIVP
eukprot:TRINITY_DN47102_c0_g1_i1.p2 TRINITY_DN47102_c0_g1~~TRINITY_DN47102_c0_g1_i1.p2  ORF type:complete len:230 (+),score=78.10 TRINITY_DN47102_c0_g1_i1:57-692(+)